MSKMMIDKKVYPKSNPGQRYSGFVVPAADNVCNAHFIAPNIVFMFTHVLFSCFAVFLFDLKNLFLLGLGM